MDEKVQAREKRGKTKETGRKRDIDKIKLSSLHQSYGIFLQECTYRPTHTYTTSPTSIQRRPQPPFRWRTWIGRIRREIELFCYISAGIDLYTLMHLSQFFDENALFDDTRQVSESLDLWRQWRAETPPNCLPTCVPQTDWVADELHEPIIEIWVWAHVIERLAMQTNPWCFRHRRTARRCICVGSWKYTHAIWRKLTDFQLLAKVAYDVMQSVS